MKDILVSSIKDESGQIFQLAEQFGLGIEILGFVEPYKINDRDMRIEATRCKLSNIPLRSLHGPFMDLFPGSRDPEIVDIVKKRFIQAYETAGMLRAQHIIFHAGYIPKGAFPGTWIKNSAKFWESFLAEVSEDIEIHIENVCEDDFGIIRELVDTISNSKFSVCLDIGHAYINSSYTLEDWIKGLGNKIKYVHMHNNDGINDRHWGLCNGNIDMRKILELLELYSPNAAWSLETAERETEESILLLKSHGFIGKSYNKV